MISPGIDGETLGIILNNLFVAFLLWAAALGRWMSWFGKLRCVYPVLHLPLPEELELYRTEAMAVLGKAADVTGDGSILLDRIVELQKELSRKRKKLADMYALLRQERTMLPYCRTRLRNWAKNWKKREICEWFTIVTPGIFKRYET